jgi:sec-independent protein translocase protein TatC
MSIAAGVARMFSTAPVTPMGADGKMALADHLRELRGRVLRSLIVLFVGVIVAFFFYEDLQDIVLAPIEAAERALDGKVEIQTAFMGVGGPLMFQIKLCFLAAVIATSPYWLYQLWAFIVPGLHAHERRYSRIFLAIAGPLFLAGVATGYYVLPTGLKVLLSFAGDVGSLVTFDTYFSFFIRMLLVFGVAYQIPLFVILLNLAGVVRGKTLGQYRPWIVIGTFVFAAAATPSTDPFSMLMLAVPMTVLFLISEVVARVLDKRRKVAEFEGLDDDQASDLDYEQDVIRYTGLDEDED